MTLRIALTSYLAISRRTQGRTTFSNVIQPRKILQKSFSQRPPQWAQMPSCSCAMALSGLLCSRGADWRVVDVLWRSLSSRVKLLALPLLLFGCATAAPPLPSDTTSVSRTRTLTLSDFSSSDATMTCAEITAERRANSIAIEQANGRISEKRSSEQTAGFVAAVTVPPLLLFGPLTDTNEASRAEVAQRYARQDTLMKLAAVKQCASGQ